MVFFSFLIGKEYLCKDLYFLYRGVFCTVQMRILEKQRFLLIQRHAAGGSELENPNNIAFCFNKPVPQHRDVSFTTVVIDMKGTT